MGKSIKLSPKYGVNPAVTVCFWCGEPNGVALMGRITDGKRGGDIEAPKYVFGGYEPCEKCRKNMEMGVTLLEARMKPVREGQPEMQEGIYPMGRYAVLTRDAAERLFNIKEGRAFVAPEIFERITDPE